MLLHRFVRDFQKEKMVDMKLKRKILVSSLYAQRKGKLEPSEEVEAVSKNLTQEFR